ncbi:hypothetical protein ABZX85_34190 [Streptomyces sp. NPDC004539]|uniref:hypothetical protein n=1 Tax=Streptomyces sp. NPDC004539 TaxID=3154280 RepID=UPI0033B3C6FE
MGDWYQVIVDLEAGETEAARLGERAVAWLLEEGVVVADGDAYLPGPHWRRAVDDGWDREPYDELAVRVGRNVFISGADMPSTAVCPRCARTTALDDALWDRFGDALTAWYDTGEAVVECPACAVPVPLPGWGWGEAPLACGYLGLRFRNWPDLSDDFRARISTLLEGHRTAYLWGKI